MLPIPENEKIQLQVIKDLETKQTYGAESYCEIEHLFYGIGATEKYFKEVRCPGGHRVEFKSDNNKTTFSETVVPHLGSEHFEVFRPMLDFIASKCPQ